MIIALFSFVSLSLKAKKLLFKKNSYKEKYWKSLYLVLEAWLTKVLFKLNVEIFTFWAQFVLNMAEMS